MRTRGCGGVGLGLGGGGHGSLVVLVELIRGLTPNISKSKE